ncbi:hypothetical protein IWQ62_005473 [Dispira parvispora]|uniref:GLTSCR protein conserved domain-containing protein n=1 Tax=Dispira parvispora TaxID=1520584 RepID=A0A9W8E4P4_9FUNG|nr:hypothetical protein IWQ62_005473 [Dispira parvispora]
MPMSRPHLSHSATRATDSSANGSSQSIPRATSSSSQPEEVVIKKLVIEGVTVVVVQRGNQTVYKLADNVSVSTLPSRTRQIVVEQLKKLHQSSLGSTGTDPSKSSPRLTTLSATTSANAAESPLANVTSNARSGGSLAAILASQMSQIKRPNSPLHRNGVFARGSPMSPSPLSVSTPDFPWKRQQMQQPFKSVSQHTPDISDSPCPQAPSQMPFPALTLSTSSPALCASSTSTPTPIRSRGHTRITPGSSLPGSGGHSPPRGPASRTSTQPKTKSGGVPRILDSKPTGDNYWKKPSQLGQIVSQFTLQRPPPPGDNAHLVPTTTTTKRPSKPNPHKLEPTEEDEQHHRALLKRIKLAYTQDISRLLTMDTERPFTSLDQAVETLLPFHVYQYPHTSENIPSSDLDNAITAQKFCGREQALLQEYRNLTLSGKRSVFPAIDPPPTASETERSKTAASSIPEDDYVRPSFKWVDPSPSAAEALCIQRLMLDSLREDLTEKPDKMS